MPRVTVHANHPMLTDTILRRMGEQLLIIVASALDTSEHDGSRAKLTTADVEVLIRRAGPLDQNVRALSINIVANGYPYRSKQKKKITEDIALRLTSIDGLVPDEVLDISSDEKKGFVWLHLSDGAFSLF
ncbi:MAG: hypothetical protein KBE09_02725 [Candidatus Pacebacteria bacterium]|nr:hypothetical protein [Candidatus Paceibacterota bacterium]